MQQIYNGAGVWLESLQAGLHLGGRTVVTATGSSDFTTSNYTKALFIECISSGSGGVTAPNSTAGNLRAGAGGVGGGYSSKFIGALARDTYTVVVGAGGTANVFGADSSVTRTIDGVLLCSARHGPSSTGDTANGSTEIFAQGGNVPAGTRLGDTTADVSGWVAGHRVNATICVAGKGGPGPFGGKPITRITQGAGAAGGKYGAGGSGGLSINAGGAATGGTGGQGVVILWEFY